MKKSILITITQEGTVDQPRWEVYAWQSPIANTFMKTFLTRRSAEDFAISIAGFYCIPLYIGGQLDRDEILRKLSKKNEQDSGKSKDSGSKVQSPAHVAG